MVVPGFFTTPLKGTATPLCKLLNQPILLLNTIFQQIGKIYKELFHSKSTQNMDTIPCFTRVKLLHSICNTVQYRLLLNVLLDFSNIQLSAHRPIQANLKKVLAESHPHIFGSKTKLKPSLQSGITGCLLYISERYKMQSLESPVQDGNYSETLKQHQSSPCSNNIHISFVQSLYRHIVVLNGTYFQESA